MKKCIDLVWFGSEAPRGTHSTWSGWGWPMFSTPPRETEMAQWIPTRWFQSAALRISNDLLIQWKPGLLLALRHQVQGFEAAGCAPAKHLPAFSRGRPVHRRGPGWRGWVPFLKSNMKWHRRPQARCWWTARWGCPGAPPVCSPTSYSDIKCQLTRPSTQ